MDSSIQRKTAFLLIFTWLLEINCKYANWEKRAPYCQNLAIKCSEDREDHNFAIYYDSKCYCDLFCYRSNISTDCCPDFDVVCKFNINKTTCLSNGQSIQSGNSIHIDRIKCECIDNRDWTCSGSGIKDNSKAEDNLIIAINKVNLLKPRKWKPAIYKLWLNQSIGQIRNKVFGIGSTGSHRIHHSLPYYEHDPGLFSFLAPLTYDVRRLSWPTGPVRNQRRCPVSHIISAVDVAADRFARQSNIEQIWNRTTSQLSIQFPLSCLPLKHCSFQPNDLTSVWIFLNRRGNVKEKCYPYTSAKSGRIEHCQFPYDKRMNLFLGGQHVPMKCKSNLPTQREILYKFGPAYRLYPTIKDIQYEIFLRGPVQGTFLACPDFIFYREGIYEASIQFGRHQCNYHSVRIIGWSHDTAGRAYWICANSWGKRWGENGYFRIYTGQNEIEKNIIATWGHGEGYYGITNDFAQ